MERIKGLKKLIESSSYRKGLSLPEQVVESYTFLSQGEYNVNYSFIHPFSRKKLLLRINCGSQMHLDNQILYEYKALQLLEKSGRTPKVLYVDDRKKHLDHGILVMEYLPGKALDYESQLEDAAKILADIHSLKVNPDREGSFLVRPKDTLQAILSECEEMVKSFMEAECVDVKKKEKIRTMLDLAHEIAGKAVLTDSYCCLINTELNSTNFLIGEGGPGYLIDWEKPIYGDPSQDLGHFLAPTTTFWKTDIILNEKEVTSFLKAYIKAAAGRFNTEGIIERTMVYIPITCLRGITWCAMAYIDYQKPDKLIVNESTWEKLKAYLSDAYLDRILFDYLLR